MPEKIRTTLIHRLESSRLLTQHGPATEDPASPWYQPDGYWSGSIWAPITVLLCVGLERSGRRDLARTIAESFCNLCARSGFAENFNALSGVPQRDPAYTRTASSFLWLAARYLT